MTRYAVTLDYTVTIEVEADTPEEAESKAQGTDITEVYENMNEGMVIHVEVA